MRFQLNNHLNYGKSKNIFKFQGIHIFLGLHGEHVHSHPIWLSPPAAQRPKAVGQVVPQRWGKPPYNGYLRREHDD